MSANRPMHRLLERQIKTASSDGALDLARLLELVSQEYGNADHEQRRTDRSITLMIEEVEMLNADVRERQTVRFEAALDSMVQGFSMFDADLNLVVCNRKFVELYDIPTGLARPGTPYRHIMAHRVARGSVSEDESSRVEDDPRDTSVTTDRLRDGRMVQVTVSPMAGGGLISVHQDVTAEIARAEAIEANRAELASQNLRFDAAVNNISQGLVMFDAQERLVICNEAYAKIYDLPKNLMSPGTALADILEHRFRKGMVPAGSRADFIKARQTLVRSRAHALDVTELEDGRVISVSHNPMADGGWVSTHEDITEQRRNEERIRHLARHDALTDLPNRIFLREEMEKAEARIRRGEPVAVLCVDLDHFKEVNDTQGHAVGDAVLINAARCLRAAARETDVVARLGGDEFAVLLTGFDGPGDVATVASRIVASLSSPMAAGDNSITVGASVGIAVAPGDGDDAETLLQKADLALYRAKQDGRGSHHFFEPGMDDAVRSRRALEQSLRDALANHELRLVYQPLLSLETNQICGVEALLRWDHPERGLVSPAEFIPIAEATGLIVPIGHWVLREACRTAATWPHDVRVAVNLSAAQFRNRGLVDHVTGALAESGLAADRLELEITESLLLSETEATLETLHQLRDLGVRIAMDDFGTGYSSLSYLRSFPFDRIKIDRSFLAGITPSQDGLAIVRAVIGLGRSLGMATTAEGVETEAQLDAVRGEGCNEVQGFLFSPPVTATGIATLLKAGIAATGIRKAS